MFDLGTQELIVIFIVAFLVFGPKRLPELGRTLGKGIRELKTAMRGVQDTINEAGADVKDEIRDTRADLEDSIYKSIETHIPSDKKDEAEQKHSDSDDQKTGRDAEGGSDHQK